MNNTLFSLLKYKGKNLLEKIFIFDKEGFIAGQDLSDKLPAINLIKIKINEVINHKISLTNLSSFQIELLSHNVTIGRLLEGEEINLNFLSMYTLIINQIEIIFIINTLTPEIYDISKRTDHMFQVYSTTKESIEKACLDIRNSLHNNIERIETILKEIRFSSCFELVNRVRELDLFLSKIHETSFLHNDFKQTYNTIYSIRNRLVKSLAQLGITEYNPQNGDLFNPEFQTDIESSSLGFDYVVHECIEPGFLINDNVILKAIVALKKNQGA